MHAQWKVLKNNLKVDELSADRFENQTVQSIHGSEGIVCDSRPVIMSPAPKRAPKCERGLS